jgi:hypothetical protein
MPGFCIAQKKQTPDFEEHAGRLAISKQKGREATSVRT